MIFARIHLGPETRNEPFSNAKTGPEVKMVARIARLCADSAEVTEVAEGAPEFAEAVYNGETIETRIHAQTIDSVVRLRGLMKSAAELQLSMHRLHQNWTRLRPVTASFSGLLFVPFQPNPVGFAVCVSIVALIAFYSFRSNDDDKMKPAA